MKRKHRLSRLLVALGTVGLLLPPSMLAAEGPAARLPSQSVAAAHNVDQATLDVALQPGGVLRGQIVRPDGSPLGGVHLSVRRQDQQIVAGSTNAQGAFAFSGLRGGVYQLRLGNSLTTFRAWATDTAPASALPSLLLVRDETLVRGQTGPLPALTGNRLLIGAAIATAIVVPIAIIRDRTPNS